MKKNLSFTLPEIIIVMAIVLIFFSLSYASLFAPKHKASLSTSVDTLENDLKVQQLKAMVGETEGATTHDSYGVHLEQGTYTLFKGATYVSGDSHNFVIQLGDNIQFTNVLFPSSQIAFNFDSGEVSGFASGSNSFTVKNTVSGDQKTVTLNRYGEVISP